MLLLGSLSVCKKTPEKEKRASSSLNFPSRGSCIWEPGCIVTRDNMVMKIRVKFQVQRILELQG